MDPRLYMLAGTFALLVIALGATIVSAIRASRRGRYVPDVEPDMQRQWPAVPQVPGQEPRTSLDGFELEVPGDSPCAALLTPLRTGSWEPPDEPAPAAILSSVSLDARVASFEATSQVPDVTDSEIPPVAMEPLIDLTLVPEVYLAEAIPTVEPMDQPELTQPLDTTWSEPAPEVFHDAEPVPAAEESLAAWPPVADLTEALLPAVADLEEAPMPPVADLEEAPTPPVADLEEALASPVADFVDSPSFPVVETEEFASPVVPDWAALLPEVTDSAGIEGASLLPLTASETIDAQPPLLPGVVPEVIESSVSGSAQPVVALSTPPDDALWDSIFHAQVETPGEVVLPEATVTPTPVPSLPPSAPDVELVIDVPTLTTSSESVAVPPEDVRVLAEPTFEPVEVPDSAPTLDLELPSVLPPAPVSVPPIDLLPIPDLTPQVDLPPIPDLTPPIDLLSTPVSAPQIESVTFPDFAAEIDAAPESHVVRPRTVVRSIESALHDQPQEPTLEPLVPAPKQHTNIPARAEFVDMVMAAPVEIWIGDSRIGVKAGTRTYNQFRKYADVLFEDLAKSKS